jgi:hypothetical protein
LGFSEEPLNFPSLSLIDQVLPQISLCFTNQSSNHAAHISFNRGFNCLAGFRFRRLIKAHLDFSHLEEDAAPFDAQFEFD